MGKKINARKLDVLWKPIELNPKNKNFESSFKMLAKKHQEIQIIDEYKSLLEELFLLRNPRFRFQKNYENDFKKFEYEHGKKNLGKAGSWFYFPWNNQLVHYLPDNLHQELRTGRNRNLVTEEEQKKFYQSTIGILGMSVGSHVALTIAMIGGGGKLKLADPDIISGSNLNRIRSGFSKIGLKKVIDVARQIFEINPYAQIEIYEKGLNEKNSQKFLNQLDLLIEEMDNPYLKIKIREEARELRIPVIMAADNGDGIIVDIERYDLKKNTPILNGVAGPITAEQFKAISQKDLPKTIAKIAGANIATVRMLESVAEVGKTLYSWPQLGNAATLCGSILAYLAKKIILREKLKTGRLEVSPDKIFEPDHNSKFGGKNDSKRRHQLLKKIQQGHS